MLIWDLTNYQYVKELCLAACSISTDRLLCVPLKLVIETAFAWLSIFVFLRTAVLNVSVEDIGVEPITSCLQGRRSSQMS